MTSTLTPGTPVRATMGGNTYTGLVAHTDSYDWAAGFTKVVEDMYGSALLFFPEELTVITPAVSMQKLTSVGAALNILRREVTYTAHSNQDLAEVIQYFGHSSTFRMLVEVYGPSYARTLYRSAIHPR